MTEQYRWNGNHRGPRQPGHVSRNNDKGKRAGDEGDFERFYGVQRRLGVEDKKKRDQNEHPQGMITVGSGNPAVEGREMPLGHVARHLEVVETVIQVKRAHMAEYIGVGEHVCGKRRAVNEYPGDKHDIGQTPPAALGAGHGLFDSFVLRFHIDPISISRTFAAARAGYAGRSIA